MIEEWRIVVGFPNYEISSLGRVRNKSGFRDKDVLSMFVHNRYLRVNLVKEHRFFVQVAIHSLVLEAFVRPKQEGEQAHHKNGNKTDNRVDNLEWLSQREHFKVHRILDEKTCQEIRRTYESGQMTQRKLADLYEVGVATINRIVNRRDDA